MRRVIVSLEEYQAVLEHNQALRKLCCRAADALEDWVRHLPSNAADDDKVLVTELRKAAQ